jgi:hypothetical protein
MDMMEIIGKLEKRVSCLEKALNSTKRQDSEVLEMDLVLPEAAIGGLRFNETKVRAVFKKKDGWYYSMGILFLSARNVEDDNIRDILTEYLNTYDFRNSIRRNLPEEIFGEVMTPDGIEVALPQKPQGIKKYNGVDLGYWLADPYSGSEALFCRVGNGGYANCSSASAVGGCAPMFRISGND